MTIFGLMIAVQNPTDKNVYIIQRNYEVSSVGYLMRGQVKDSFKFLVRSSFPCIDRHTRNSVMHEDKVCHIQMSAKPVAAYAFVNKEYPQRIIFAFLKKTLDIFFDKVGDKWQGYKSDENLNIDAIATEFNNYQDPAKVDKLMGAQLEVDKTKIVLHESIKKLLERQGDLDQLVEKSKDLSLGAKEFYKTSKKMDKSCCNLI